MVPPPPPPLHASLSNWWRELGVMFTCSMPKCKQLTGECEFTHLQDAVTHHRPPLAVLSSHFTFLLDRRAYCTQCQQFAGRWNLSQETLLGGAHAHLRHATVKSAVSKNGLCPYRMANSVLDTLFFLKCNSSLVLYLWCFWCVGRSLYNWRDWLHVPICHYL